MRPGAPPPLLLVHGAFAGAWCWREHMVPWLRERGHRVSTVDLPGRRGGADAARLQDFTLTDYVDAVARVMADLAEPPVVVGHSMGALREPVAGLVLLSSVPPTGLSAPAVEMALGDPELFGEVAAILAGEGGGSPEVLRRALFADTVAPAEAMGYLARFQSESRQAVLALHGVQAFNPLAYWWTPLLILGGAEDRLIGPAHVHWTATLLGRRAEILPGLGHAVMLEPGWIRVAERIHDWVGDTFSAGAERAHG